MTDRVLREIIAALSASPEWAQAVRRVDLLFQDLQPDAERASFLVTRDDLTYLAEWLTYRAESIPGLRELKIDQRGALLLTLLQDLIAQASSPEVPPGSLPDGLEWLLGEIPRSFWTDMGLPEAALIQLYPKLLEVGGPEGAARITDQFAWMLSRFGARRITALILTSLGASLPTGETPVYLSLCEAVLRQANAEVPPGIRRKSMAKPPEEGVKGIENYEEPEPTGSAPDEQEAMPPESAPQPPRQVYAEVYHITPGGMNRLERAFAASQPHHINLWIGDPRQGAIRASQDFQDQKLPEGLPYYPLTVTFSEPQHCPQLQVSTIFLFPNRRDSTECGFEFATRTGCPDFRGRMVISYHDAVLQTLLLTGSVVTDPAQVPPDQAFKLTVEAALEDDFAALPPQAGRDAHLLAELRSNDLCLTMQVRGQPREYCVPDFKALVKTMSAQFDALARMPDKYKELNDPASVSLLRVLAEHGYALYEQLSAQLGREHPIFQPDVTRLQLLSTQEALIPLELIYTADALIEENAPLCPSAEQALRNGQCTCPEQQKVQASTGKTLCPLRFWGLSRQIERHKIPRETDLEEDLPRLNPGKALPALQVIQSAVVAASNRADDYLGCLQQAVHDNFEQASGVIQDWEAWPAAVQQFNPSLLLLIPHAKEQDGFMALEIGKRSTLKVNRVRPEYVRSHPNRHPVALVLGCSTAKAEISFESCTAYFRRGGAALTVTTLSPVLARHVVPVATRLVQELKAAAAAQRSFGAALLRTRQQALADGYPAVMTLIADGNMDWSIA